MKPFELNDEPMPDEDALQALFDATACDPSPEVLQRLTRQAVATPARTGWRTALLGWGSNWKGWVVGATTAACAGLLVMLIPTGEMPSPVASRTSGTGQVTWSIVDEFGSFSDIDLELEEIALLEDAEGDASDALLEPGGLLDDPMSDPDGLNDSGDATMALLSPFAPLHTSLDQVEDQVWLEVYADLLVL